MDPEDLLAFRTRSILSDIIWPRRWRGEGWTQLLTREKSMVTSSMHTTLPFLHEGLNCPACWGSSGYLSAESVSTILKGLWGVVRMRALHEYGFTVKRTKRCRNGGTNQLIHTRSHTGRLLFQGRIQENRQERSLQAWANESLRRVSALTAAFCIMCPALTTSQLVIKNLQHQMG